MKLDVPFKVLPVKPTLNILKYDFNTIDWSQDTTRQRTHPNHQDTLTFPIVKSPFTEDGEVVLYNKSSPIYDLVMLEVNRLELYFNAKVRTAVLAGVIPGGVIPTHRDESILFHKAHRCHLPLVTSKEAEFIIDDISYNLECGTWFEIDNRRPHSVINNCKFVRIHLLVDLMPNDSN